MKTRTSVTNSSLWPRLRLAKNSSLNPSLTRWFTLWPTCNVLLSIKYFLFHHIHQWPMQCRRISVDLEVENIIKTFFISLINAIYGLYKHKQT